MNKPVGETPKEWQGYPAKHCEKHDMFVYYGPGCPTCLHEAFDTPPEKMGKIAVEAAKPCWLCGHDKSMHDEGAYFCRQQVEYHRCMCSGWQP